MKFFVVCVILLACLSINECLEASWFGSDMGEIETCKSAKNVDDNWWRRQLCNKYEYFIPLLERICFWKIILSNTDGPRDDLFNTVMQGYTADFESLLQLIIERNFDNICNKVPFKRWSELKTIG